MPNPSVVINPEAGSAFWRVKNLVIPDYTNAFNALANGPTLPGKVSFEMRWSKKADSKRYRYSHAPEDGEPDAYRVDYWNTGATLDWEAETPAQGFSFTSTATTGEYFAVVGHERNGVFF